MHCFDPVNHRLHDLAVAKQAVSDGVTTFTDVDALELVRRAREADGGTRTASICGGFLALHDALSRVIQRGELVKHPLHSFCSAISVGIVDGTAVLDLPGAFLDNRQNRGADFRFLARTDFLLGRVTLLRPEP